MLKPTNFLLKGWMKFSRVANQDHGFTLIELLIGLVMAFLIMTPLFVLMLDIMNTDKSEQAKTSSEQELQTAMDFITRDLQQAVYIYDSQGVTSNYSATAASSGIKDSLPTVANGEPILVFWKRELVSNVVPTEATTKDDAFVYSLVAYYLIKDSSTNWSNAARIARWQIKDGVRSISNSTGTPCTGSYDTTLKFVATANCPDGGFVPFNLDRGTGDITQKMNQWRSPDTTNYPNLTTSYTATTQVLVDYIDQTVPPATPTANSPNIQISAASCGRDANQSGVTITPVSSTTMTSFYVCVSNYLDKNKKGQVISTAQIFLRGNALARMQSNSINYTDKNQQTFFPTVSAIVQARGFLYTQ
jgi:type II secretory pathway pseudopilin PulG